MYSCKKCENEFEGNYCPNCGTPVKVDRISGEYLISEVVHVINFEKGILYTIRELILRPGLNVRLFLLEDRNRLVKPIVFLIITSLIYTIAQQWLYFEDGYVAISDSIDSAIFSIFAWVQQNYGYANILMAFFIGFWIKIFFKKYDYNYFEIIILLCFIMGMMMLFYTIFGILESLFQKNILHYGSIFGLVYIAWTIGSFFDKSKKLNYVKAVISYLLGMVSFTIGVVILGLMIDYFF